MQICSFPAALCGSELAASSSHHTAEVMSLGLPQFFKQNEKHHKFGKAEKISLGANAQFGKTKGGRNNWRYAHKAYTHILSLTLSSWGQKEKLFSVIFFKDRPHTTSFPACKFYFFFPTLLQGIAEILTPKLQAGVEARIADEMSPAFRLAPCFSGKKTCPSSVSLCWLIRSRL